MLFVFSFICFLTSFFLNKTIGKPTIQRVEATGGEVAIRTETPNTVLRFDISQQLLPNSWSYLYITLEDTQREELCAFSEELWAEAGIDQGYHWSESKNTFTNKFSFSKPGVYYLVIEPEVPAVAPEKIGEIKIKSQELRGSNVPHLSMAIISLLLAIVLNEIANLTLIRLIF